MDLDQIRQTLRRQPFRPFTICTADGREVPVTHPDLAAVTGRSVLVVDEVRAGVHTEIELRSIVSLGYPSGSEPSQEQTADYADGRGWVDRSAAMRPSEGGRLVHADLSKQIIGASMAVLNELGPGLSEKIYENSLIIELSSRGLRPDAQRQYTVHYKGHFVGKLIPDLIVDEAVIVDTKVVESFTQDDLAQVLGYLAITGLELGLLINFKYAKLQWKRVVRSHAEKRTGD